MTKLIINDSLKQKINQLKSGAFIKEYGTMLIMAACLFIFCFIVQFNLIIPIFLLSLYVYFKQCLPIYVKPKILWQIVLLTLVNFAMIYFFNKNNIPFYFVPFIIIPMLSALLFANLEISLVVILASSIPASLFAPYPLRVLLFSLISGLTCVVLVNQARKRSTIIKAGVIIGFVQIISLLCMEHFWFDGLGRHALMLGISLVSSFVVLGILPVFEYLFETVTNISLLELADFHRPLLQRMILEAPGTFHHSLIVGNMSETACAAIKSNALLARVGAYYHDIGKLNKPDYFSENQNPKSNKHDALAPTMSKLIIINHVKEGVDLARKAGLNPPLLEFILRHHGNSLVYYFYKRALEGQEEAQQEINEEGFRYPGPKPHTKETAVVMLADSVEAATRALKEPSPSKIEEVVHKIINNRFIDGQLDECELTLKDLEKISAVFIKLLSGIYHSRITYPEDTKQ